MGDSKTPLKFLAFSSILNAVLDLIFIGGMGFGIVCSAVTTVVAEAASAFLCITYVYRKIPMLQLRRGEFNMDRQLLRQTLRYGSITALQQSCQPIGKLLIQGAVNPLGVDMIAAFNAVNRIDDFAFTPEQSISHGITTFVAQNRGAGRKERIQKGFRRGLMLEACYWVFICITITLFRRPLMGLFVTAGNEGQLSGNDGVILCVSGIYQWNPGIFQGNGKDERYSVGNLCPNQPQGSVCVPVNARNRTSGGCICLRHRLECHAFG